MGVTAADFDGDGDEDIFKTNLTNEGEQPLRQRRAGNFHDASAELGLFLPTFPYTGFGTEWFDYDNDGRFDLFIANGAVNRIESLRGYPVSFGPAQSVVSQRRRGKEVPEMSAGGRTRFCPI